MAEQEYRVLLGQELILKESRNIEFKAGPGFIKYKLRNSVGKYMSGFLNSNVNGRLMIGVDDEGDLYVIVLSVNGSNLTGADRLYGNNKGVFIRRDGSLQGPLKHNEIQDWVVRDMNRKIQKMQTELENVKLAIKRIEDEKQEEIILQIRKGFPAGARILWINNNGREIKSSKDVFVENPLCIKCLDPSNNEILFEYQINKSLHHRSRIWR